MSIEIRRLQDYDRNEGRCKDSEIPSAVCGRPVKDPWPHWIRSDAFHRAITKPRLFKRRKGK